MPYVLLICTIAALQTPTPAAQASRHLSPAAMERVERHAAKVGLQGHPIPRARAKKPKPLTFEVTTMADGFDTAGTEAGFQSPGWDEVHWGSSLFKASDGQHVAVYYTELRSAEEADRYFEWKLDRVANVTKTGDKVSPAGKRLGRRAEVVVEVDRTYSVIWTNRHTVRQILARDMAHALALEKLYGP